MNKVLDRELIGMELFFTSEKMVQETIATHVGRLQRNFWELNNELKKLRNIELPEILLTSRIMSTLPSQYFEFKSVCSCGDAYSKFAA